jgi:hypothetical protein
MHSKLDAKIRHAKKKRCDGMPDSVGSVYSLAHR